MKIEVVGSGGAFSTLGTSFLVDDFLLVDCGDAVVKKLLQNGQLNNVSTVLITHKHFDHINGVEAFVAYKTYVQKADFAIVVPSDAYALLMQSNICIAQAKNFYKLPSIAFDSPYFSSPCVELPISILGYDVVAVLTNHADLMAFGYSVVREDTETCAYFSGDVDDLAPLTPAALDYFHIIFHDVGWTGLEDCETRVHPFEDRVAAAFGNPQNLFGVHTDQDLQHMKQAKAGDIFTIT